MAVVAAIMNLGLLLYILLGSLSSPDHPKWLVPPGFSAFAIWGLQVHFCKIKVLGFRAGAINNHHPINARVSLTPP